MIKIPKIALRIWLIFSATLIIFSVLQTIFFYFSFNDLPDEELYIDLSVSSGSIIWVDDPQIDFLTTKRLKQMEFSEELIDQIIDNCTYQDKPIEYYFFETSDDYLSYSIELSYTEDNRNIYILTYFWDSIFVYTSELIMDSVKTSLLMLLFILIPAYFISKNLVKPILSLKQHALKIAGKDLTNPIEIFRKDEIGDLSKSLEIMRKQLKKQDDAKQRLFQSVSHELKTPVMVIRSYIQAIKDEVGNRDTNLDIIDKEILSLNHKVSKLVSMAKLEYLTLNDINRENINISDSISEIVNRFKQKRKNIKWEMQLEEILFNCSKDLIAVLFENILDNQIRYAKNEISIFVSSNESEIEILISNDGPLFEQSILNNIFDPFAKGNNGISGLGLSIAKEIVNHYKGNIIAENISNRAIFKIFLPSHNIT